MKLNDTTFRPFFITLKDWTFRNAPLDRKLNRQVFFFNFMNKFLDTLQVTFILPTLTKTVVIAYYGIILDDTIQLLHDFQDDTVKAKDLWVSVVNSLNKTFTYDLDQDCNSLFITLISAYWSSPTRFNKIVLPLLSQLTLPFKSTAIVSAIVSLASKAGSEENYKIINGTLMEYLKSESSMVRLAALNTQRELYSEMSAEWLKMLPPMVPVISEVMEDEDDDVIEAAHELIATIEKVGGISMQKLLT